MAKDYTGLVGIADDYINFNWGLWCMRCGHIDANNKDYNVKLEKKITEVRDLLNNIQSKNIITSAVLSGKYTLEDLVRYNYKDVKDYVESFEDFKDFQPDKNLDKKTRLLLRELYNSSEKGKITNNPMLTENIKRFGEKKSIFNPKRYDFWDCVSVLGGPILACSGILYLAAVYNQSLYCAGSDTNLDLFFGFFGSVFTLGGSVVTYHGISSISKKSKLWDNPEKVLSVINDESASQAVRARKFD